jgi:hypothetical protein
MKKGPQESVYYEPDSFSVEKYIWVHFLDMEAIKILSLGAIWNFSEGTGLFVRPRCIGTVRAGTHC